MIYVYAVLGRPARAGLRGFAGAPVRSAKLAGLNVATSRLEAAPAPAEASLQQHDEVVRALGDAVLPVRFGTALPSLKALEKELRPQARSLREALALVAGREQMTLRVLGKRRRMPRASGTAYLKSLAAAHAVPELAPLREKLSAWVRAERVLPHPSGPLTASVYHLVDRGAASAYLAAVRKARLRTRVIASGPFPPYAFAPQL